MISRCCSSFTFCTNLDCFIYHASVLSILQYALVCGAFCHLFVCTSNTEQHLGRVIYVQSSILESHQPAAHIKLFLSFICYSVLSILQYISVWCLLSSFLLHFLYKQYIGRVIYVQGSILQSPPTCNPYQIFLSFICSTCNSINLQSTLNYCMLHLIQVHLLHLSFNSAESILQCTPVWRLLSSFLLPSNTERHLGITTNLHSIFDNSCLQCILNCYRYAALDPRALVASLTLIISNAQNSIIHCIEYSNAKQQKLLSLSAMKNNSINTLIKSLI